ncbi:MAG: hypothetical protein ACKV2T_20335 [Kofleriaceae bacterium]
MTTKLFASLVLTIGLSACLTEVDDDNVLDGDDLETVATDPGAELASEITGDPPDRNVAPASPGGTTTCGGQPRRKADGPCLPK